MNTWTLAWYGLGVAVAPATYAAWFGYFQGRFAAIADENRSGDRIVSGVVALIGILMGPLSLVFAGWRTRGFRHGFRF